MRSKLFPLFLLFCIQFQYLDAQSSDKYFYLAKIWGFAKYYHPTVTDCQINWDDVLLGKFAEIEQTDDLAQINALYLSMLDTLGSLEAGPGTLTELKDSTLNNLDLAWIGDPFLSADLQQSLSEVKNKMRSRTQCSYEAAWESGNLIFEKDNRYANGVDYPEKAKRFLAVARWWNIIEYLFPYKYQTDLPWDRVLQEFTPAVLEAEDAVGYHRAIKTFTAQINDAHAWLNSDIFFQKIQGYLYPPFTARYVEGKVVVTQVLPSSTVKLGEIVQRIDGTSVEALRERYWPLIEGSNPDSKWRNFITFILVGPPGPTSVVLEDELGNSRELSLSRTQANGQALFEEESLSFKTMHTPQGCEVGYVNMGVLTQEEVPEMFAHFKDLPGIILDIRNYPKGTMWTMVPFLYPNGVNLSKITYPDPGLPGRFKWHQHSLGQPNNYDHYRGKLVFLFDERTQSQAEFTIMGLEQAPGGSLKIGSPTAGADGNVSTVYLPGNIAVNFSGLGIYYPDGRETQRIGIVPDVMLRPTIAGIRSKQDELLNYALQCANFDATPPDNYQPKITLSPNPTIDLLQVHIGFDRQYTLQIFNSAGQHLQTKKSSGLDRIELEVKQLAAGVYTLRITDEEGNITNLSFVKI